MLAIFCLRLACGLAAATLLLPLSQINSRFFRAQFLTVLGLVVGAAALLWQDAGTVLYALLGATMALSSLGSFIWSLDRAPLARFVILATTFSLVGTLVFARLGQDSSAAIWPLSVDDLSSALVLGTCTTAMLIGHSYLIAPAMSIKPLMTLLGALFVVLIVRMAISAVGLTS